MNPTHPSISPQSSEMGSVTIRRRASQHVSHGGSPTPSRGDTHGDCDNSSRINPPDGSHWESRPGARISRRLSSTERPRGPVVLLLNPLDRLLGALTPFLKPVRRFLTRCFPRPLGRSCDWRWPRWPQPPHNPPLCPLISALSALRRRSFARPIGSSARSRSSRSGRTSSTGLMGTLPVIPEVKA